MLPRIQDIFLQTNLTSLYVRRLVVCAITFFFYKFISCSIFFYYRNKISSFSLFILLPENMKGIVDSICNTFQIPHIMAHWTYDPIGYHYSSGRKRKRRDLSVNVYPDSDVLSAALADLIRDYDWTSYTILYDTADSKLDQ